MTFEKYSNAPKLYLEDSDEPMILADEYNAGGDNDILRTLIDHIEHPTPKPADAPSTPKKPEVDDVAF